MVTQNLTCSQIGYLIKALAINYPCGEIRFTPSQSESETPLPVIPPGFKTNRPDNNAGWDPENEVIFDPENEVIFDPESEVIFDPEQAFNPADGIGTLQRFQSLYDCYGNKIKISQYREELIKLLIWLFKYEQYKSVIESYCSESAPT